MKFKLLAVLLLAGSSMFAATRFFVGVGIGNYGYAPRPFAVYGPPPAPYASYVTRIPGAGYSWVPGYWYPEGRRWGWRAGYWARPPYARSYWVAPRYHGHRYYPGYWRRHR